MYYVFSESEGAPLSLVESYDGCFPFECKILFSSEDETFVKAFMKGFTLKGDIKVNDFTSEIEGSTYRFIFIDNIWKIWQYKDKNSRFISEFALGDSKNVKYITR